MFAGLKWLVASAAIFIGYRLLGLLGYLLCAVALLCPVGRAPHADVGGGAGPLSRTRPETHLKQYMAPFYIHDGAQALTLRIIGLLTKGAAAELERAWLTARSTLAGRELLIDLTDVISVDDDGQTVLRRLAGHGARFITTSRLTDSLAEEVSRRMPELLSAPRPSAWKRLACCLRTFCGVAKASMNRALPCGPIVRKLW